jgi:hypothetical protein
VVARFSGDLGRAIESGVSLRAGLLRAPLSLGPGGPLRALHIPNADQAPSRQPRTGGKLGVCRYRGRQRECVITHRQGLWITVPPDTDDEPRNSSWLSHRTNPRQSAQEIQSAISRGWGNPDASGSPVGQGNGKLIERAVPPGQGGLLRPRAMRPGLLGQGFHRDFSSRRPIPGRRSCSRGGRSRPAR